MAIAFTEEDHKYISTEEGENIDWLSASKIIEFYKNKFDSSDMASKSVKKKTSKWYGMSKEEVLAEWDRINKYSTKIGTAYHNMREQEIVSLDEYNGLKVFKPIIKDGIKYAPSQKLEPGIYPEHMVYLKSAGICGQSDKIIVEDIWVDVEDYKTNKSIDTTSYVNYEGISKKMNGVLSHLDDCNYYHYAIQMSIYMYITLKHNPKLKPRNITLEHIKFKVKELDRFDNPIYEIGEDGIPIVEEIVLYQLPYLKEEVTSIIKDITSRR